MVNLIRCLQSAHRCQPLPLTLCYSSSSRIRKQAMATLVQDRLHVPDIVSSPKRYTLTTSLAQDQPFEEETLKHYDPDNFYPVRIGDTYRERYTIVAKLGYGNESTVWLCRDLVTNRYSVLKACTSSWDEAVEREHLAYNALSKISSSHEGRGMVEQRLDSFVVNRPNGTQHRFYVLKPLYWPLEPVWTAAEGEATLLVAKGVLTGVLQALDFLHTEAGIIHGDIAPDALFFGFSNEADCEKTLAQCAKDELENPSRRKIISAERVIYGTRSPQLDVEPGDAVLFDFGKAHIGPLHTNDVIQREPWRAPEVMLGAGFSFSADIWNAACMVWALIEQEMLFNPRETANPTKIDNPWTSQATHLAEMVACLGPPPREFLNRSIHSSKLFDDDGNWKLSLEIPKLSLEDCKMVTGEERELFLDMMRKMLTWLPEERQTAKELAKHPWLNYRIDEHKAKILENDAHEQALLAMT